MAKSQYTDSITGEVICDVRAINGRIVNVAPNESIKLINYYENTNPFFVLSQDTTKYSQYSMKAATSTTAYTMIFFKSNKIRATKYTLSMWICADYTSTDMIAFGLKGSSPNRYFHYSAREAGSPRKQSFYLNNLNSDWTPSTIVGGQTPSSVSGWAHYAVTFDGVSNYRVFENGNLISAISYSNTNKLDYLDRANFNGNSNSYFDDFVFINNQCLWTSNFTPPDYFLTGDHNINRLKSKMVISPSLNRKGDYFDKAFLY